MNAFSGTTMTMAALMSVAHAGHEPGPEHKHRPIVAGIVLAEDQDDQHGDRRHHEPPKHDGRVQIVEHDQSAFGADPHYEDTFDFDEQYRIYGDKAPVTTQRPLLELGRPLFREGPFRPAYDWFGEQNPISPHFLVYGDWRVAAGSSSDPNRSGRAEHTNRLATQLNLDLDLKLTATERIHAFVQPFNRGANFTRIEDGEGAEAEFDLNLDALYFEGDIGAMLAGVTGEPSAFDLPIAFGKMPLLFQNGVWVEDAFTGVAVTLPAKNSPLLDISNMDITFFAGFDDVTTDAVGGVNEGETNVFGVTAFIELLEGYMEVGYGFVDGHGSKSGFDYHNLTAAFTRRYGGLISNSLRVILNLGQDVKGGPDTAEGALFLIENSLITSNPSTVVPYANFFVGIDTPQSLARAGAAGGVLKNTGINFEADAITGFPSLDARGHDAVGGAIGMNYLFGLDQQVVFEVAGQTPFDPSDSSAKGDQLAFGIRWQKPFMNRFIVRADTVLGVLENEDNIAGIRLEFRWKF